jgi:hypothetical protein
MSHIRRTFQLARDLSEFYVESNYVVCKEGKPYQEQKDDDIGRCWQMYVLLAVLLRKKKKLLGSHHAHQIVCVRSSRCVMGA